MLFYNMSLPSNVGIPQECKSGLDYSLPQDAKSFSVKVQPSNVASVVMGPVSLPTTASSYLNDPVVPSQSIIFDLPTGGSPSQFLDTRMSTLCFQVTATYGIAPAPATANPTGAYLRGGAYSYFDRLSVVSQNGAIIEDISEFGLIQDTLVSLQMNNAVRHGLAINYGFDVNNTIVASQGHKWNNVYTGAAGTDAETHTYAIPLCSGILGCLADKFLNIGRTSKLQLVLQTSQVLPVTLGVGGTAYTAGTMIFTLSNIFLQLEYVDIGMSALGILDSSLVDGKSYSHATTYRTTSTNYPVSGGSTSLLAGIRASSVKSLFCRFAQGSGTSSVANGLHGKYNSFNPSLNSINFNVGGIRYPQTPVNPLLNPALAMAETQKAIGSFNSATMNSCIVPSSYCRLSAGAAPQSFTVSGVQDYNWSSGTDAVGVQSQFIFGENVEVCAKRSLLSGLNCTSAPIFLEVNASQAVTAAHTVYVQAMLDMIIIHDVATGDIQTRV